MPKKNEPEIVFHPEYIRPQRMVFRIMTDGKFFRVQHKTRVGRWLWLEEERVMTYVRNGRFTSIVQYTSRESAVSEIKRAFGEQVEIVREWRCD